MIGPLSSQLNAIKWGEFRLGDLFEASNGDFDIQKRHINHKGEFVITAGLSNNGVLGQSDIKAKVFESHTITIDMFGCAFYRSFPYKMVTHARVFSLKPKFEINHKIGLFLSTLFFDYPKKFGYENMCSWAKIKNDKVILPLKPTAKTQTLKDIDFNFMEKFIAELEQCRLAELEAYLKATGLSNTTLSNDEENALNLFDGKNSGGGGGNTSCGLTWQSFKLGDLFEIEKTLSFNKDALTQGKDYDYITRTSQNQGVLQTTGFVNAENLNPPFTWSLGLLQMDFFYRKKSWYAGQFMRKITLKTEIENKINSRIAHYFTTLLNALKRPLLSVLVRDIDKTFREQKIQLPLKPTANTQTLDDIDFNFMRTLINALMKQTIQGVAEYCDAKIQATKEAISQEAPTQKDSLF
ncbi:type IIS restriction enzyme R protein [Helicobacter pylori]|uniref:restriction endonuclease subunit S n=1 Tax=Helicobacter pylori TaxID=210 RepID=UPI0020649757|nr:restriction endonuclease subunit S [Helicobacter pylori]BCJ00635.1 type IIS restriction enzyme R protein [Helicobacter pylori]